MLLTADSGGLFNNPYVRVFRCSAYVFEPEGSDGVFSLDGEVNDSACQSADRMPLAMP